MKIQDFFRSVQEKQERNYLPVNIVFELTPYCNFNCNMCYIHINQNQHIQEVLSTEQWLSLIREASRAGALYIGFTGGEVLTRADFRDIYEEAYNQGLMITVLSNGYLINDDVIKWLSEKKPKKIRITLYGASDETYHRVCGIDNGFTVVSANIQKLIDAKINVSVCMTVTNENKEDLSAVKEYALSKNIGFAWSDTIRRPARITNREVAHLRVKKTLPVVDEEQVVHEKDLFPFQSDKPFSSCRCYKTSCIIGWNGKMIGCNFINSIYVDALKGELVTNFRNLWDRLSELKMPEKCKSCKYLKFCNPCPGTLEPESGDPETISDYVCELAKYRYYTMNLLNRDNINNVQSSCEGDLNEN